MLQFHQIIVFETKQNKRSFLNEVKRHLEKNPRIEFFIAGKFHENLHHALIHVINQLQIINAITTFCCVQFKADMWFLQRDPRFYQRGCIASYASAGFAIAEMSVRLSICPSLWYCIKRNNALSYDFFTDEDIRYHTHPEI